MRSSAVLRFEFPILKRGSLITPYTALAADRAARDLMKLSSRAEQGMGMGGDLEEKSPFTGT
jgi:hypothetical protein